MARHRPRDKRMIEHPKRKEKVEFENAGILKRSGGFSEFRNLSRLLEKKERYSDLSGKAYSNRRAGNKVYKPYYNLSSMLLNF